MSRKCAGSVWEGWGRKLIEEREAKIANFSLPFSSSFAQEARLGMCVTCEG